ncbi:MAG: glycoside hydrolase family 3 protein, partial [Acidimicrobiia bacterium]|nr:glycoside hydrolase family 3 protein [Acidimicrobiia bacterium]
MSVADPHLLLAFEGSTVPTWLGEHLADHPVAGVTLFREHNLTSPAQTAELVADVQRRNGGDLPLFVAIDQEGGQLLGLVGSTPFAGNMALGATGDPDLAERVAHAMGQELAAVGINLTYAPAVDVASEPANPSLGVRSFGDDPAAVGAMTAAVVRGFETAGVRSTVKHFPGKGEASVDPHYELPILAMGRDRFDAVELPPFRAGFDAGASLLMVGHYVVPALTGSDVTPIPSSRVGIDGLVRDELGFDGLVVTDALDMGALDQGPLQAIEIVAMMRAGVDLLLCMPDRDLTNRVRASVERGAARGVIPADTLAVSRRRIDRLRRSLVCVDPNPGVVGNAAHMRLADELARCSVTLVRNDDGILPLDPSTIGRVVVLEPEPSNVTPADTTRLYEPELARSVSMVVGDVTSIVYPHEPGAQDIASVLAKVVDADLVIVGTVNASPGQPELVEALIACGPPVVTVALRTPFDLTRYPMASTYVCTYSSHAPSMRALADTLFGR